MSSVAQDEQRPLDPLAGFVMLTHIACMRKWMVAVVVLAVGACSSTDASSGQREAVATEADVAVSPPTTSASVPTTVAAPTTAAVTTTTVAASTTTAATTTTVAATTTAAPPSASDVYLALVTPLNCVTQFVELVAADVYGADGYVYEDEWWKVQEKLQPAYRSLADANVTWIEGLLAYTWPAEVSADVAALVAESSTEANFYERLASATTFNEFFAMEYPTETGAATVVRAKLGLPSNVNSAVNFCEGVVAG